MIDIASIKERLLRSKLFKDSFWAVFGNGLGNGLLLLSGIIIARLLGKDLYGEYGVVKLTMFYIAMFACFGLGTTSTKYIANFVGENKTHVRSIMRDAMKITLCFSSALALLILIFANQLANFLDAPQLSMALRFMAIIIVFKALNTTQNGVLAGLKDFRRLGINSILSGVFMLAVCFPLTYQFELVGALVSLSFSQCFNYLINAFYIAKIKHEYVDERFSYTKELIRFSLPVALQEGLVNLTNWCAIMLLTKMSSTGELGLYSASIQWNAIVSLIPTLLMNVILSYISSTRNDKGKHDLLFKRMVLANFISTLIPVIVFFFIAGFITSFYGESFAGMTKVLRVLLLVPLFGCCGTIFKAEYVANNKSWLYFILRIIRDIVFLTISFFLLYRYNGLDGAFYHSISTLVATILFFVLQLLGYVQIVKSKKDTYISVSKL